MTRFSALPILFLFLGTSSARADHQAFSNTSAAPVLKYEAHKRKGEIRGYASLNLISEASAGSIELLLLTEFKGKKPPTLKDTAEVTISVRVKSENGLSRHINSIDVIVDGKPIQVRDVELEGSAQGSFMLDFLNGHISLRDLRKMGLANETKLKFGSFEYAVDEAGRRAMRQFVEAALTGIVRTLSR
jgi:hypothetical protein